jgi:hypothetical protein
MTKIKLSSPFSYGDELSSQQARVNLLKISTFKKEVFLALCFFMSSALVASARDFLLPRADGFTPAINRKRPSSTVHQFGTQTGMNGGSPKKKSQFWWRWFKL